MRKLTNGQARYFLVFIVIVFIGVVSIQLAQGSWETKGINLLNSTQAAEFNYIEIDNTIGGDIKLVGDIDGDSFPDLVMGGLQSERLNWYRYPNWDKYIIHTPDVEFTTDGALGDVDDDGDLDIVVPDGNAGNNLRWFENPLPSGDPTVGAQWTEHTVGSIGDYGKDVYVADYDSNGRLDVATRQQSSAMIFFQTGDNIWTKMTFSGLNLGNEGMTSGRVDNDGNEDLVLRGAWVKNPGGTAARTASNWTQYTIGAANSDFKALVVDLDKDGVTDVLFSSSENTDEVVWYEPATGDPTGAWTKHIIVASLERAHTLQVADMDLDGDNDIVLAQMHTSSAKEIMIMDNQDGQATSWQKQVIDDTGIHNGVVADIGNDGDFDIFGANWAGNPPVKLFVNQLHPLPSLDLWTYKQVTSSHQQTFGLTFGDVNGDGPLDIISGQYWYKNPGGDMLGSWTQTNLPAGMQAVLVEDVDGDALFDLIAQQDQSATLALYWLEAANAAGTAWNSVQIGTVPAASHALGAQGYRIGQIVAGGRPEIAISSGQGIYYFTIPASPGAGGWPRVQVNSNPSDEGFALGDIDRDNQLDIAASTGDSKRVEWYRNPGNGTANWTAYHIGDFQEALYPDRTEVADINGDNRLDIIVTEENGLGSGAETYWWEAPVTPTNTNWTRHLVTSQATTNSLDTADMDYDGDSDIVLAEHRGTERVTIWENDGSGGLTEHLVGAGHESHLGAQAVDLDWDGDLDLVSIAYDDFQFLHLWRNDAAGAEPGPTPTATPACYPTPLPGGQRVTAGQQVLYLFSEGSGLTISDSAGVSPPINLTIDNGSAVSWVNGGGLDIISATIIQSSSPPTRLVNALTTSNELTLEAWVIPDNVGLNGPARILTLSEDPFFRNFTLGQEFDAYEIRLRTTSTDNNGLPAVTSPGGSATIGLTHLVYTRQENGQVNFYINNTLAASANRGGNFSNWDSSHLLALGDEISGGRSWLGTYHLVAIYNRDLSSAEVNQNYLAGPRPKGEEECNPTATPTSTTTPSRTPTATATSQSTATSTSTSTRTPTATTQSTATSTSTATRTPTVTATGQSTATSTSTITGTPTATAQSTATSTPTATNTVQATFTSTPTGTITGEATTTNTPSPTATPTEACAPTPEATPDVPPEGSSLVYLPVFLNEGIGCGNSAVSGAINGKHDPTAFTFSWLVGFVGTFLAGGFGVMGIYSFRVRTEKSE